MRENKRATPCISHRLRNIFQHEGNRAQFELLDCLYVKIYEDPLFVHRLIGAVETNWSHKHFLTLLEAIKKQHPTIISTEDNTFLFDSSVHCTVQVSQSAQKFSTMEKKSFLLST